MERSAWPKNLSSSRKHEIKDLLNGQNPAKRLRHLFDAHSETGNNRAQPLFAEDLIFNVLRSFSNTLSLSSSAAESNEVLQVPTNACVRFEASGEESIKPPPVPTKASVRPEVSEESIKPLPVPRITNSMWDTWIRLDLNLSARKTSDSITVVTTDLEDGHQWRKYGRPILNCEFPRQYFRCDHYIDQGCQASKQVRKTEDGPSLYRITYRGHHTCKNHLVESPQIVLDSASPSEDDLNLSLIAGQDDGNKDPIFFDFLSVNQEQKLPSEDDPNPHGHSHDNHSEGRRGFAGEEGPRGWCRECGKEAARVLILPCRHLCLCPTCELSCWACPVCRSAKNTSVVVNMA